MSAVSERMPLESGQEYSECGEIPASGRETTSGMGEPMIYHIHPCYPWHCGASDGMITTDERNVNCPACAEKKAQISASLAKLRGNL